MFDTKKKSMNNVIACVAPKSKSVAYIMRLKNRISCVVGISIFWFKTYWKRVLDLMEIKKHQPPNSSCKPKHSTLRKKVIISTIRYQATESLPQAGNDQTTNIGQYACKAKWDGL